MKTHKTPAEKLGEAVRLTRLELGISQEQLAFNCSLHRTYIGSIERGERNVSLKNILTISEALGIDGSELLLKAKL